MWRIAKVRADGDSQADNDGLMDQKENAFITLMNGQVTGSPGCGHLFGTYKLSENVLTLNADSIISGSGSDCPSLNEPYIPYKPRDGVIPENPFHSDLRIEQRDDQILLRDKSGQAQMLLVPSVLPAQQPATPKPEPSVQQPTISTPSAVPTLAQTTPVNGATTNDLEGHQWRLSQFYATNKLLITLPLRVPIPYFAFRDGKIEGSVGCGQFTGTYRGTDDKLAISAKWADDKGSPCSGEQKNNAAKILHSLASVRRIKPIYDALLLLDKNGALQVRLEAMQSGKDLSELHDTFWLLKQVEGSTQELSHVVIYIDHTGINFITPSYRLSMIFQYDPRTERKFFTPYVNGGDSTSSTYIQDQQVANAFENALQKIASYETKQGNLTFYDKDRQLLFVLNPIQSAGIEYRQWRIAKYRVDNSDRADKDGLIDATEPAWVLFMNGSVSGTPGAGAWKGTYKLSNGDLEFDASDPGYAYSGAFREEQAVQDDLVCKAFKGTRRIEQRGDQILLRDKSGQAQILLEQAR